MRSEKKGKEEKMFFSGWVEQGTATTNQEMEKLWKNNHVQKNIPKKERNMLF